MAKRPGTRETLARNMHFLMERGDLKQTALAKKSGVGQRTISNMLNPDGPSPALSSVTAVANAFGLTEWDLIRPNLISEIESNVNIKDLMEAFEQATPEGKQHIIRIAEREAEYQSTKNAS